MRETVTRTSGRPEARWSGRASAVRAPGRSTRLLGLLALLVLALGGAAILVVRSDADASAEPAVDPAAPLVVAGGADMPDGEASRRVPVATRPARAAAPADGVSRVEREPPSDERRGPRTEAEHCAVLRLLARSDPAAFGLRAEEILAGNGPAYEQFAALRAAYEEDWPGAADLYARAVRGLPTASGAQAESVPQTLVHWLGLRAPREPRAREALAGIAWGIAAPVEPGLRIRALRALVLSSPEADLALIAARIHAEGDPDVHSAGRAALDERARPAPNLDSSQELP